MRSKFVFFMLSLMLASCFRYSMLPVAYSTSGEPIEVQNMADLLNHIPSIEIEISNHEGFIGTWGYEIVGEETISDTPTWKVESTYGEEDEEETITIWVSKSDGSILQVEIEGETMTGTMAVLIGNATFSFWTGMVYTAWKAWDYTALQQIPEYGHVSFLGSSTETYGPTVLTVFKYRFEGLAVAPETYRYIVEIWSAPTQFGGISTYLYVESLDKAEWFSWELLSIELTEPQEVPPDIQTQPTPTPSPTPTPTASPSATPTPSPTPSPSPSPTPTPTPGPSEETKKRGIPGFPYESIVAGIVAGVIILWFMRRRT